MFMEQPARRHAELERVRADLSRELAAASGPERTTLERKMAQLDRELQEVLLDIYNRSSMDADSEA